MKNYVKNSLWIAVATLTGAVALTACSDWTEPQSLDITTPSLEEQNPGLYAAYMQNLRDYKAGAHKIMFVSFENRADHPSSRAEHLAALPDSVDYISINNPAGLSPVTAAEMAGVREKGTRVVYEVDHALFEAEWQQKVKDDAEGTLTEADAVAYLAQRTKEMLALCGSVGFDGIIASYTGRSPLSLTGEAADNYKARQKSFFDLVAEWRTANPAKAFSFCGAPQYLYDESKALLAGCDYIILPTDMATGTSQMSVLAEMAASSGGVPTDRFVFAACTTRYDDADFIYGYFVTTDPATGRKAVSVPLTARWIGAPSADFTRAGMMIRRVEYDYYDLAQNYRVTRGAIATMNPSPKN